MRIAAVSLTLVTLVTLLPATVHAQKKWTQIGTTASGNPVFVDLKSVKKSGPLVDATVRVVFVTPVDTPKGAWMSGRITGTYDCVKKSVASKEQRYYGDKAETKVVERKVNKMPGYGPALAGSLPAIALDYLCRAK
ncbi:MAG: surface-adhesin E family protein [Gemmatimonadaceae bacterium]